MSNCFDPDQARRFVGPDLGPNCLKRLSADDTSIGNVLDRYTVSNANYIFNSYKSLIMAHREIKYMKLINLIISKKKTKKKTKKKKQVGDLCK